jgi:DUF1680 family protein
VTEALPHPTRPATTDAAGGSHRPVVSPTSDQWLTLRPLEAGAVRLGAGFWSARVGTNEATLETCYANLERAGNLDNLRLAAQRVEGGFRGLVFADTDVYKWLEAVSWTLQREWSGALNDRADLVIELLGSAQEEDGYLDTYVQLGRKTRWLDLANDHELYCAGHLIQSAVAHHRATGKNTLLRIAERFASLIVQEFGEDGVWPGYCGHPEVETALIELYRETGRTDYLELASRIIERRGGGGLGEGEFGSAYFQDDIPVRDTSVIRGHAVRALYLAAGVTDLYLETGDATLLARMTEQWADMIDGKTYVTGGIGARHNGESFGDRFELPSDRAYTETCATVASMHWAWRMLLATGDARYADLFERTLFNGFLAGVSLDGTEFFYVNPLHQRQNSTSTPASRQPWYKCACCPPNVARMLASVPHYVATHDATGLQIHQYASASIRAYLDDGTAVGCDLETEYPFDGRVEIAIPEGCEGPWTLALRIPQWATGARVIGRGVDLTPVAGNFAKIRRDWKAGDRVSLTMPVTPRLIAGDPRIDAIRGCVALELGPLVYCFEDLDQQGDLEQLAVTAGGHIGPQNPDLLGSTTITVPGVARASVRRGWPFSPLDAAPHPITEVDQEVLMTAIPYFAWANREPGAMRVWMPAQLA